MARGEPLSGEEKGKIAVFKEIGLSNRQIAKRLFRSSTVVDNFVKLGKSYGEKKQNGAPSKLSEAQRRLIKRKAVAQKMSARQIQGDMNLPVTPRRVRQILSANENLKFKKPIKKPPLTSRHRDARIAFARKHISWTKEWENVIFSDEKKFNLDGPDGFSSYWHDLRAEEQVRMSRNFGGGTVMIWAAFYGTNKSRIGWISTRMNGEKYVELLEEELINILDESGEQELIFQQDNASIHRAKKVADWFSAQKIPIMAWPSRSPDLNPIENIWGVLARDVYKNGRQFNTTAELKEAIRHAWVNLPSTTLTKVVESMPNRLCEVLINSGGSTKY